jgi:DNA helicase-2/ATP-dependent DNA helicase PcrA
LLELPRDELRMIGFGPQTAADYRDRMIADAIDAAHEGIEPEHLDADALDFEVHDIHADVTQASISSPAPDAAASQQPAVTLATAAELHDTVPRTISPISPDDFAHGMVVRHPEYGLGKIIALSGAGPRRVATVAFASSAGQKKFVLSQSQLRPANTR